MRYVIGMLLVLAGPVMAGDRENMVKNCVAEWPSDYQMQVACTRAEGRARKGVVSMINGTEREKAAAWHCLERSPGAIAGIDWTDAHSCAIYVLKRGR